MVPHHHCWNQFRDWFNLHQRKETPVPRLIRYAKKN
jgi:hypothetical protein